MADIVVKNLNKGFGDLKVLDDFSEVFEEGRTSCIMGSSGCGKTTLLNILMGLLQMDSGTVSGVPARLSAVFQEDRLLPGFSAIQNIAFVCPKVPKKTIIEHLARIGLGEAADKPVSELSGGMKRRVAIARAVLARSELMILDEPFKGLDEETRAVVAEYLAEEAKGRTIIMVTHDEEEVQLVCGRLIRMRRD